MNWSNWLLILSFLQIIICVALPYILELCVSPSVLKSCPCDAYRRKGGSINTTTPLYLIPQTLYGGIYIILGVCSAIAVVRRIIIPHQSNQAAVLLPTSRRSLSCSAILPCYTLLLLSVTVASVVGIILVAFSTMTSNTTAKMLCSFIPLPLESILATVTFLWLQPCVSTKASVRAIASSGILTLILFLITAMWSRKIFPIVYEILCIAFLAILLLLRHTSSNSSIRCRIKRILSSYRYKTGVHWLKSVLAIKIFLLLAHITSLVFSSSSTIIGIYAASVAVSSIIIPRALFAILISDSQYWLGTHAPASTSVTDRDSKSRVSLSSPPPPCCDSVNFSNHTSSTGVHTMIEEHQQNMIDASDLQYTNVLAKGATSVVFAGKFAQASSSSSIAVAIKVYTSFCVADDEVYRFSKETALNVQLSHPNIVKFYGVSVTPPVISLVFEYCPYGALDDILQQSPSVFHSLEAKLKAWVDACESLAYLHSFNPPLLHRDIKSGNFLLSQDGVLKLTDFGEANLLRPRNDGTMTIVGTVNYMAPEMIAGRQTYDASVDVYGLAIVLWEILHPGKSAYDDRCSSHLGVYNAVLAGTRPALGNHVPQKCRKLLSRAWDSDPLYRPTAQDVANEARRLWLLASTSSLMRKKDRLGNF